jgi:hypothetical protein
MIKATPVYNRSISKSYLETDNDPQGRLLVLTDLSNGTPIWKQWCALGRRIKTNAKKYRLNSNTNQKSNVE